MIEKIEHLPSAWKGHGEFAMKLVNLMQPEIVVDLGVDYGYSTFAFALPNVGKVIGVDLFWGDVSKGDRNTFEAVTEEANKLGISNLEIIKGDVDEVAKLWSSPIDILHIDADHEYESVKRNYVNWLPYVKETGVILFHDTISFKDDVGRLFNEISLLNYGFNFEHSYGLGVICFNEKVFEKIKVLFHSDL